MFGSTFKFVGLVRYDKTSDTGGVAVFHFGYEDNPPFHGTIKEIEIVRMNILERKLSDGRIYHEVAALEKGQRTDRDPYYLISRAQGILDQGINQIHND